jgi:hypothetical protein
MMGSSTMTAGGGRVSMMGSDEQAAASSAISPLKN